MNIKLAYNFDLYAYKSLFPEITLFDLNNYDGRPIDLMVFPGGEDVSLEFYCNNESMISEFSNVCYTNRQRDDIEISILNAIYNKGITVNKILGVCRGMQLINVMADGKLFQDLEYYGFSHPRIHEITHLTKSNLGFLKTVNSLHHQGVSEVGKYNPNGNRSYPIIIATDKSTRVPEIMTWENDRILGVQFHPEYFGEDNPDKKKFIDFCYSWLRGETSII